MSNKGQRLGKYGAERYESDLARTRNAAETLNVSRAPLGQNCPQHYPQSPEAVSDSSTGRHLPLGPPITIGDVAAMLGCSTWTVRQRYMRNGLPYLRVSPVGKLVFFRDQVIDWILQQQILQKGGMKQ